MDYEQLEILFYVTCCAMAAYSKEYRGTAIVLCAAFISNFLAYGWLDALSDAGGVSVITIASLVNILTMAFFFSLRFINIGNKAAEHQIIILLAGTFLNLLLSTSFFPHVLYIGLVTLLNLATIYILRGGIHELIRYGISNVRFLNDIINGYNRLSRVLGGHGSGVQTDRADKKTMAKSKGKAQ